jgi:hypothetical protein
VSGTASDFISEPFPLFHRELNDNFPGVNDVAAPAFELSSEVKRLPHFRKAQESIMNTRLKMLSCATALALGLAIAAPASARTYVGVSIGVPPPPVRVERVVARPGYVWAPGYWSWNGGTHVWVGGYWAHARPGYRYVPAAWVHAGPNWRFHAGYWRR